MTLSVRALTALLGPLQKRWAACLIGFGLVTILAVLRIWDPYPVEALRLKGFDGLQRLASRTLPVGSEVDAASPVVIVDIDEESLDRVGQWPWPRTVIADLVAQLMGAGAPAIGFDVLFSEPDRMSPEALADRVAPHDTDLAQELRFLPSNDARLAQAFRRHGGVVVAQAVHPRKLPHDVGPVNVPSIATLGPPPDAHVVQAAGVIRPLPALADAAAGVGMISLWESPDNIVRRVPLVISAGGAFYPALSMEMLRVATAQTTYVIESANAGMEGLLVGRYRVPTDYSGQIWVHYRPSQPRQYVSAADVLEGHVPADRFRGKLVLVGTSATGLGDIKATPIDPAMPGVEVHAQALETVLTGQVLRRPGFADALELATVIGLGALVIALVPCAGAWTGLVFGGVVAAGVLAGTGYAFAQARLLLDPVYSLGAGFLTYTVMVFANYLGAEREKRFIRGAFTQYLTPALVDRLAREPDMLRLGGETRPATVLFSDIRGFTGIAEHFGDDAEGLTHLVNRVLTPLSDQVLENNGTIDKYIGDAIMAFWNAPLDDPRHADHACEAALGMVAALEALNGVLAGESDDGRAAFDLRAGIGINSGACLAGNLGTNKRFNYSVMGDTVNVAARLEALTRTYGVDIIVGEATASSLDQIYALVELDVIQVKGRQRPARIFALVGRESVAESRRFSEFQEAHERLLRALRDGKPETALQMIQELMQVATVYGLAETYALYHARVESSTETATPAIDMDRG